MFPLFLLIIIGTALLSFVAAARVKSTYLRNSQIPAASGRTGAEVAGQILQHAGIHNVEIVAMEGMLGDHYDPINKRLVLSNENYYGNSCAALGVAAHECGHAIQDKIAFAPLRWRMASVGVTTFANQLVTWLPLVGMFTGMIRNTNTGLMLMALGWGIIMLFNLITLPVEFDASRRAKEILAGMGHIGTPEQVTAVRKTLDAAAWTYVAAFITSLVYALWHILPLLMGHRDEE